MPQGDGAAIDVRLLRIKPQFLHHRQRLHGKCLVEFDQVHLLQPPAHFGEERLTGAIITQRGSTPLTACPTIRAMIRLPVLRAVSSEVTTTAAAPSLVPGAFPAVTVPSGLNAGFSRASASSEVSARGDSSIENRAGSPFF